MLKMESPVQMKRNMKVDLELNPYFNEPLQNNIQLKNFNTYCFMDKGLLIINNNFKIQEKYNSNNEVYSNYLIHQIITRKRCHITLRYTEMKKEKSNEYLKRFYNIKDVKDRLPKICNYYRNFQKFLCKPVFANYEINILIQCYFDEMIDNYYHKNYNHNVLKGDNEQPKEPKIFTTTLKDDIQKHTLTKSFINLDNNNLYNISSIMKESTQNIPLLETNTKDSCFGNIINEMNKKTTSVSMKNIKSNNPSLKKFEGLKEKIQENISNYLLKSPSKNQKISDVNKKLMINSNKNTPLANTKRQYSTLNVSPMKKPSQISVKSVKTIQITNFSPKKNNTKYISSPTNMQNNTPKTQVNTIERTKSSNKITTITPSINYNKSKEVPSVINLTTKRSIIDLNRKVFQKQSIDLYKGRVSKYLEKTNIFSITKNKVGCSERTLSFDNKSTIRKDINTSKTNYNPTKYINKEVKKNKQVYTSLNKYPANINTKNQSNMISISLKNLNVTPSPTIITKKPLIQSPVNKILINSDSQRRTHTLYQSYSAKK